MLECTEIIGIIKRIGHIRGPDSESDFQFILEDNKDLFVIDSGLIVGLTQVGDIVKFIYYDKNKYFAFRNVNSKDFKNLSIDYTYRK